MDPRWSGLADEGTSWACDSCTFLNQPNSSECEICGTEKPLLSELSEEHFSTTEPNADQEEWVCKVCTFVNVNDPFWCEMCGAEPDDKVETRIQEKTETSIAPSPAILSDIETQEKLVCEICTFLNKISNIKCELCESPLNQPKELEDLSYLPEDDDSGTISCTNTSIKNHDDNINIGQMEASSLKLKEEFERWSKSNPFSPEDEYQLFYTDVIPGEVNSEVHLLLVETFFNVQKRSDKKQKGEKSKQKGKEAQKKKKKKKKNRDTAAIRKIHLQLQVPHEGNQENLYFLDRIDSQDMDERQEEFETKKEPSRAKEKKESFVEINIEDWINDVNKYIIEQSMPEENELPPHLALSAKKKDIPFEHVLDKMMDLLKHRRELEEKEREKLAKQEQDDAYKKYDENYFQKYELYFQTAKPIDADKLEDHLKAYGITQEVQAMRQICSKKSIQIQKKHGLVSLTVPTHDVVSKRLAKTLQIKHGEPVIITLDFSRLPYAEKLSDITKAVNSLKRGQQFPVPLCSARQGDVEAGLGLQFYFKSVTLKFLQETWQPNSRKKNFGNIRSWFSKNNDKARQKGKEQGDEGNDSGEEMADDEMISGEEEGMWVCDRCTYLNAFGTVRCEICQHMDRLHPDTQVLREKGEKNVTSDTFIGQCSEKFFGGNFFVGLLAYIRAFATGKVYLTSTNIAWFVIKDMLVTQKLLWFAVAMSIVVCPYFQCKEMDKMDRQETMAATAEASGTTKWEEMDSMAEKLLLSMYRHRFLPNGDVKYFFSHGYKSWWGLGGTLKVTRITNVLKPFLVKRFLQKQRSLSNKKIRVGYHGTEEQRLPSILEKGLLVPGKDNDIGHKSDTGWWGGGIYLSPSPMVSSYYAWNHKLLVCAVLLGKPYHCKQRMDGQACKKGFDSHISPWWSISGNMGNEWVLFDEGQVLPCYVIEFSKE